jgi:Secretion system C-terminal sorting domain
MRYFFAALVALFAAQTALYAQPTSGLRFWLRASDITGVTNGQPVGTWPDNSGNGRNATATGIYRPILTTNAINGLPTVRFTGNGGTTKDQPLMVVNDSTPGPVTVITVIAHQRPNPLPPSGDFVDILMGTKKDFPARGFQFSSYNTFANRSNREVRREGGINAGTDGDFRVRKNGAQVSPTLNLGEYTIINYEAIGFSNTGGSGFPFTINATQDSVRSGLNDIAEILVYNRTLSRIETDQVELYLSQRYGIALPSPFTPSSVLNFNATGLALWLDPAQISDAGQNLINNPISGWFNRTSRNHAQSAGTARPTLATFLRGIPMARFDGTNDTMSASIALGANTSYFMVVANNRATVTGNEPAVATNSGAVLLGTSAGRAVSATFPGTNVVRKNGATTLTLGQSEFAVVSVVNTGGAASSRVSISSLVGGSTFGNNDVHEVLVFDRALPTNEVQQVENYLSLKYGISVPTVVAPTSIVIDDFTVSDTLRNGWRVLPPAFGPQTRDRYTIAWQPDAGQPAFRIGNTGTIGINGFGRIQNGTEVGARTLLPGNLPDTLGGDEDGITKVFKSTVSDTTPLNLSRAKVIHVFARTSTLNTNRFNRDISPTLEMQLLDASRPPYVFPNGDTLRQRRVTNGGGRFSNDIARQVTLVADNKYREYIYDFTNNFRGLSYDNVFGFGSNAGYVVDSSRIEAINLIINRGRIYGSNYRHDLDDADREIRVVGNKGSDGEGGDFVPVYTSSSPRFRGSVFIQRIVANDDPFPIQRVSSSATPSVPVGTAGEGAYVLGGTGAYLMMVRGSTTAGSITATRGAVPTVDTVRVVDTVGVLNAYRINDQGGVHLIAAGRVFTINQTGLSASTRFDVALPTQGLLGIRRPNALYVAYRPNSSAPWQAVSSYLDGNYIKAFNRSGTEFGQYAIASSTSAGANPLIGALNAPRNSSAKVESFELKQNYPNPFNPTTVIAYQLPQAAQVSLEVFDILGRKVATLVNEQKAAGNYAVPFNGVSLASGVYFYRLQAGNFVKTNKMMLIK